MQNPFESRGNPAEMRETAQELLQYAGRCLISSLGHDDQEKIAGTMAAMLVKENGNEIFARVFDDAQRFSGAAMVCAALALFAIDETSDEEG